jgi:excisionase family DNA binding protein
MASAETEDLLTPQEVADRLRVDTGRLAQMRHHGTGPVYIKVGRSVRYRSAAVDEYLEQNTIRT